MDYSVSFMSLTWRKLIHGLLGLNLAVFLEKNWSNGLYVSTRSWKLNAIIKGRHRDYLASLIVFFEKTQ